MSVKQLDSGKWQARWNDRHPDGKRWQRFESFDTKTEATNRERRGIVEAAQRETRSRHAELRTVAEMVEHYKSLSKYQRLAKDTKTRYELIIRHFLKWCEEKKIVYLQQWSRELARQYELWSHGRFAGKGVNHVLAFTKALFSEELLRDNPAIRENPFILIKQKRIPRKDIRTFTQEEIHAIINVSTEYTKHLWNLLLFSGMRTNELLHLRREHVKGNVIRITSDPYAKWRPKTFKSNRVIPNLAEPAVEALEYFGTINTGPYLFSGSKPKRKAHIGDKFRAIIKRVKKVYGLDISDTHPHCFRYTFGSLLLQAGTPIETVAELLGHSDIRITQERYAKLSQHNLIEGMERLRTTNKLPSNMQA